MKTVLSLLPLLFFWLPAPVPVLAGEVVPAYEIQVGAYAQAWRSSVRFKDAKFPEAAVSWENGNAFPYEPAFLKSPNGKWFLFVVKTGSGDNTAWLYTVDGQGRVFGLQTSLDSMAWRFSDRISSLPRSRLYHTGMDDPKWTEQGTLTFRLRGTETGKSGGGVNLKLEYDPAKNIFSQR